MRLTMAEGNEMGRLIQRCEHPPSLYEPFPLPGSVGEERQLRGRDELAP
jgi:hypothetical protein